MKKAWYKKWWIWAIVVFIMIGIFANSNNDIAENIRQKGEEVTGIEVEEASTSDVAKTETDEAQNADASGTTESTETETVYALNDDGSWTKQEELKEQQEEYISALGNIYTGVKVYSRKSEDYYLGTITAIDDNYRGISGNKAVYVTGGLLDGWYSRQVAIQTWYIKSNDPALPYNN